MGEIINKCVALAGLVLVLVLVNFSIAEKEGHLRAGQVVLLKLAPVDPRSIMQGDYMALNFELANELMRRLPKNSQARREALEAADGYIVVRLDGNRVASFDRLYNGEALKQGEVKLLCRVRNSVVKFATNAFFFQEGKAKIFERAQFGGFRVNSQGELLLTEMLDEHFVVLGNEAP